MPCLLHIAFSALSLPVPSLNRLATEILEEKKQRLIYRCTYTIPKLCIVFLLSLQLCEAFFILCNTQITILIIVFILITCLIADNWFCYKKLDFDHFKNELLKSKNLQANGGQKAFQSKWSNFTIFKDLPKIIPAEISREKRIASSLTFPQKKLISSLRNM